MPYIGADAIAAALNPPNPASVQIAAARKFVHAVIQQMCA